MPQTRLLRCPGSVLKVSGGTGVCVLANALPTGLGLVQAAATERWLLTAENHPKISFHKKMF